MKNEVINNYNEITLNTDVVLRMWFSMLNNENTKTIEQRKLITKVETSYNDAETHCCIKHKGCDLYIDFINKISRFEGNKFVFDYLIIYENIMGGYNLVFATENQVKYFCSILNIPIDDLVDYINYMSSDIIQLK